MNNETVSGQLIGTQCHTVDCRTYNVLHSQCYTTLCVRTFDLSFACSAPLTAASADAHCKRTNPGAKGCGSR